MPLGMFVVGMCERPHDPPLVASLGEHGQVFANLYTGRFGGNRLEFAPHLGWSRGFKIETLVLGEPPTGGDYR